ncbi:hypothetical protein HD806DRAFT_553175, partial [Xylariaceae sp. AK1471]
FQLVPPIASILALLVPLDYSETQFVISVNHEGRRRCFIGRPPSPPPHEETRTIASSLSTDEANEQAPKVETEYPERPVTVGVRYYNYEAFMNRTMGDEGDYVIEVLITKSNPGIKLSAEVSRRNARGRREPRVHGTAEKFGDDRRLQRVRIRSEIILSHLSALMHEGDGSIKPLEFRRPFGVFLHYYEDMRNILADLETAVKSEMVSDGHVTNSASVIEEDITSVETIAATKTPGVSPETALQHMRLYVQFVEEKILPLYLQYHELKPTVCMIRYEDIPFLFKLGGLVFNRLTPSKGKTLHRSAAQHIWRMGDCQPMDHPHSSQTTETRWTVYYLDFFGEKVVPIWSVVTFEYFSGEKDVTELNCFPLEFHPDHKSILEKQKKVGMMFKEAFSQNVQHLYYSGWTFVTGVLAETLEDEKGSEIQYPDYIESEVVIDCNETIRAFPMWQTETYGPRSDSWQWIYKQSEIPLLVHTDNGEISDSFHEMILSQEYNLYVIERRQYFAEDVFLQKDADLAKYTWRQDDLALLPKRIFGYVLRERRFSRLDVTGIQWNSTQNKITLDNIEMNEGHRKIIRSAVSSHFKAQQQEKTLNISTFNLDAIRGKGKGLTILLHGAPGVGKTATAEAVAIETNKPLFPITCGDLGTKPEVVDKTLRDIFRYAHQWECILLFDEADVFLTQRERSSLERNALVGVFLRVLEYYRGVLFLTTNRVGALDEAFRSRVHVSLWYPHLTVEHTIRVLRSSLDRLPQPPAADGKPVYGLIKVMYEEIEDFVTDEYNKYSRTIRKKRGPWNGRQIRNAVQIAACLALYQKETENAKDGFPAVLTARHFKSVAETTSDFENFLKKARIGDDSYWAQQRNDPR